MKGQSRRLAQRLVLANLRIELCQPATKYKSEMPLPLVLHFASRALRISNCKRSVSGFGHLLIYDGERFRVAAVHAAPSILTDFLNRGPFPAGAATGLGRLASTKRVVHVADLKAEQAYLNRDPLRVATVDGAGARTGLAVPMLKENKLVGAIVIYRQEVRPFTDRQI